MSAAHQVTLNQVIHATTVSLPSAPAGAWKKFTAAFWDFVESTARYHTEQAKKNGYYHYY